MKTDAMMLGALAVAAAGSFAWFSHADSDLFVEPHATEPTLRSDEAKYRALEMPRADLAQWTTPGAQRSGPEWIYDLFTPPQIFYHSDLRQFVVTPPEVRRSEKNQNAVAIECGVTLVAVKPELFRLQLVGYVESEGTPLGIFENVANGEIRLASVGFSFPGLRLVVESLALTRQPIEMPESMTVHRRLATAALRDERAGTVILLTENERCFAGPPVAVVTLPGSNEQREVREGDVLAIDDAHYRVAAVRVEPAAVELSRVFADESAASESVVFVASAEKTSTQ